MNKQERIIELDEIPVRIASRLERTTFGELVVIDAPEYRLRLKGGT